MAASTELAPKASVSFVTVNLWRSGPGREAGAVQVSKVQAGSTHAAHFAGAHTTFQEGSTDAGAPAELNKVQLPTALISVVTVPIPN